jgi:hypothetical protein
MCTRRLLVQEQRLCHPVEIYKNIIFINKIKPKKILPALNADFGGESWIDHLVKRWRCVDDLIKATEIFVAGSDNSQGTDRVGGQ